MRVGLASVLLILCYCGEGSRKGTAVILRLDGVDIGAGCSCGFGCAVRDNANDDGHQAKVSEQAGRESQ